MILRVLQLIQIFNCQKTSWNGSGLIGWPTKGNHINRGTQDENDDGTFVLEIGENQAYTK